MIEPYLWTLYSKKFREAILHPVAVGPLTAALARENNFFFAQGSRGTIEEGNRVDIFLFINPQTGIVADARFLAYGHTALIGACECVCHAIRGRSYKYASALSLDLFRQEIDTFPLSAAGHILLVIEAFHDAASQASHITAEELPSRYPDFASLPADEQRRIVTRILDAEIRPFLSLDSGGADLIDVLHGKEIIIAYSGACANCFASGGSTLAYIQQVMQRYLGDDIVVTPRISLA
jgi:NifU-like protein